MKILAIESAQATVSVAVAEDDKVLAEYTINGTKDHSRTLVPVIEEMTKRLDLDLHTLDAVAISGGPGSFTGLRIGSATAKALAYSLRIPVIHVPTPDLMAYGIFGTKALICPLMDARNSRVFTGVYENKDKFLVVESAFTEDITELAEKLNAMGRKVIFTGEGTDAAREILAEKLTIPFSFAPAHLKIPRAAALAVLAMEYAARGEYTDAMAEVPDYLRASQAEREFKKRMGMTVEEASNITQEGI